jgi:hypothetical protein
MKLPYKIILPMAAVAVIAASGLTAVASAASSPTNPQGSIVQKITDTFHRDKSKVQAVFDQNRADHQAQAETNYETHLNQAVTDNKITSAQKDLILAEHNKLKAELDAAQGTDRRTTMKTVRTEAQAWAKSNNIDAKWLLGPRPLRGMGHGMRHGNDGGAPAASPTPKTSF